MTKHEVFIKNKELIPKNEWEELVDKWSENKKKTTLKQVKEIIIKAVEERIQEKKVGVMFSGGIDSTLIAKLLINKLGKENVILVSVGCFEEGRKYPEDLEVAKTSAKQLAAEWHTVTLTEKDTERVFDKTIKLLRKHGEQYVNSVNVSVGAVEVAAYEKFSELGIKQVFGGLGSEEVFAGYLRHENAKDLREVSIGSIKEMRDRDLVREYALANHFKMISSCPLMDEELLELTLSMPESLKQKDGHNKYAVRSLGEDLGLDNAFRKKRAAQYGSRTQAFLTKICNKKGYKTIKECLIKWN